MASSCGALAGLMLARNYSSGVCHFKKDLKKVWICDGRNQFISDCGCAFNPVAAVCTGAWTWVVWMHLIISFPAHCYCCTLDTLQILHCKMVDTYLAQIAQIEAIIDRGSVTGAATVTLGFKEGQAKTGPFQPPNLWLIGRFNFWTTEAANSLQGLRSTLVVSTTQGLESWWKWSHTKDHVAKWKRLAFNCFDVQN